jgi:hypothetical protein
MYVILNRALGLVGLTKTQAEEILGLPIKTAIPYMEGNFALANNLHQSITTKYPSIILKETAGNMVKLAPSACPIKYLMKVKGNFQPISTTL